MKVWDLHCDTLYELRRAEKAGAPKSFLHNDLHIRGGTLPRRIRPPTAPTASVSATRCRCIG